MNKDILSAKKTIEAEIQGLKKLYSSFKNSSQLRETFNFIPNDKIIIETDSPFLAPFPKRGKKNERSHWRRPH